MILIGFVWHFLFLSRATLPMNHRYRELPKDRKRRATSGWQIARLSLLCQFEKNVRLWTTRTRKIINTSKREFSFHSHGCYTPTIAYEGPLVNSGSVKSINLVVVTPPRHFLLPVRVVDLQLSLSNGLVLTSERTTSQMICASENASVYNISTVHVW